MTFKGKPVSRSNFPRDWHPSLRSCPKGKHDFWIPCDYQSKRRCPACERERAGHKVTSGTAPLAEE